MTNALSLRIKAWCLTGACLSLLATFGVVTGGCGASKERISNGKWRGTYQPLICRVGDLLRRPRDLRTDHERWYFIRDLGTTHDPAAYLVLAGILQDDGFGRHERDVAATALAATGDPRALDTLEKAVEAGLISHGMGVAAFGILAVNGENAEALNHVLRATRSDPDVEVRLVAVSALRSVNPDHAGSTAALERMVRSDPSKLVRVRAACVLVAHGDKSYWKFVNSAARDQNAEIRLEVAQRVPFQAEAIPVLLHLLGDKDRRVVFAAWEPLAKNLNTNDGLHPDNYYPCDVEWQREVYRKAWEESQRK